LFITHRLGSLFLLKT